MRKREQKQKDREVRRNKKQLEKLQAEEQRKLQEKIKLEERKLLLAQRNLQSIRLIAELLSRAKVTSIFISEANEESNRTRPVLGGGGEHCSLKTGFTTSAAAIP